MEAGGLINIVEGTDNEVEQPEIVENKKKNWYKCGTCLYFLAMNVMNEAESWGRTVEIWESMS